MSSDKEPKKDPKVENIIDEEEEGDSEEFIPQEPSLKLAEIHHLLSLTDDLVDATERASLKEEALQIIKKYDMKYFYEYMFGDEADAALVKEMDETITKRIAEFDQELKDGEDTADFDVQERTLEKAKYLAQVGDQDRAIPLLEECLGKAIGGHTRIDIASIILRLVLSYDDKVKWSFWVNKVVELVDKEGDWERRNRTSIYRALMHVVSNDMGEAATLLMPAIPTYTCTELMSFDSMVLLAVITAVVSQNRVALHDKLVECSDAKQVLVEQPAIHDHLMDFYECRYKKYCNNLLNVYKLVMRNRFLHKHAFSYIRNARYVAYAQYLSAFRSVAIANMANTFGLKEPFLVEELIEGISSERLGIQLDGVNNAIEVHHGSSKMKSFDDLLASGDAVFTKITALDRKSVV